MQTVTNPILCMPSPPLRHTAFLRVSFQPQTVAFLSVVRKLSCHRVQPGPLLAIINHQALIYVMTWQKVKLIETPPFFFLSRDCQSWSDIQITCRGLKNACPQLSGMGVGWGPCRRNLKICPQCTEKQASFECVSPLLNVWHRRKQLAITQMPHLHKHSVTMSYLLACFKIPSLP